jgi:hypothetical protein
MLRDQSSFNRTLMSNDVQLSQDDGELNKLKLTLPWVLRRIPHFH